MVTSALLIGQYLGWMQPWELGMYDRMVRWYGDQGADPRLLVVKITEEDIQAQKRWPLFDQTLANALKQLQKHKPRAIGLDLYRDFPYDPGYQDLVRQLRIPNIVVITKLGSESDIGVPPPPTVLPQQVGFNDVVLDPDSVVRRNLMYGATSTGNVFSFAFRLAALYLNAQGIKPRFDGDKLYWGKATYTALQPSSGTYQGIDSGGYQVMLRYRSAQNVARQVTLTQVLQGNLNPAWVRNKIVLIGSTAPSTKDFFQSPYSPAEKETPKMPGVIVHAQMVSQLLTAANGDPALFWDWSDWAEAVWILVCSVVGGLLAWRIHHPLKLGLALLVGAASPIVLGFWAYTQLGWIPVVTPALALLLTGGGVITYTIYQIRREQQSIASQAEEQEKTIALLRTLLAENVAPKPPAMPSAIVPPQVTPQQSTRLQRSTIVDVTSMPPTEAARAVNGFDLPSSFDPSADLDNPDDDDRTNLLAPDGKPLREPATVSQARSQQARSQQARSQQVRSQISQASQTSQIKPLHTTAFKPESNLGVEHTNSLLNQRYHLTKILGSGGFGMTYLAEDTLRPGNPVCVVKRLMPARTDDRFLQTARRLFRTEAEILEKLGKHDQIPQLLASFEEDTEFYLVQEFIDGHTLTDELMDGKRLAESDVVRIIRDVLHVLEFIHDRRVIHRDLKPGNLIRRHQDNQLVLIDFGAVKQIQPQEPNEGELATVAIGTRGYAPAEQLAGHPTFNSDLYALGMICIQALTGKMPHHLEPDLNTGSVIWRPMAQVSPDLAMLLDRMVCYYFSDRYQSAQEVMRDLKPLLDS